MSYIKTNWVNGTTPINDTNLNNMENGIEKACNTTIVTTANTDLNDYTETGLYYFHTNYVPTNIPAGTNGWLMVIKGNGNSVIKQIWSRQGTPNTNDFETYIRTKSGTWGNWQRVMVEDDLYYKAGESVTLDWKGGGYLTTAGTQIQFSIPLPKRIKNTIKPTITSGRMYVRMPVGGYLVQNVDILEDNTIALRTYGNILDVIITHSTAYEGTNNVPLGLQVSYLKIEFENK